MSATDIIAIIDEIPNYIQYIYPGYLTIYIYLFCRGGKIHNNKVMIVQSIAISYVEIQIIEYFTEFDKNSIQATLGYLVLSFAIAYSCFWVTTNRTWIPKLLKGMNIYHTFYGNEMEMLSEFYKGAWLVVYLKEDVVYEGALHTTELEDGKQKHITLTNYSKYKNEADYLNGDAACNYEEYDNEIALVFYENIKRIEKRESDNS